MSNTHERTIYRTNNPSVIAAWDDFDHEERSYRRRLRKWLRETFPGQDVTAIVSTTGFSNTEVLIGVQWYGSRGVPEGWKYERNKGLLSPKKTSKAGKAAWEDMQKVQPPKSLRDRLVGMPGHYWSGLQTCKPGVERHGDEVFVIWPYNPMPDALTSKINDEVWQPIKLSEFYALLEAEDA